VDVEVQAGPGVVVLVFAAGELIASAEVTDDSNGGHDVEIRIVDPKLSNDVAGMLREVTHSFTYVTNYSSAGWRVEESPLDPPF